MLATLPQTIEPFMDWDWARLEPLFTELEARPLSAATVAAWLADWSELSALLSERRARLGVATSQDTTDAEAEAALNAFLADIYPPMAAAQDRLRRKLLASGLAPAGMATPLQEMRVAAELFREANVPLLSEETRLGQQYNKIIGGQTVDWEGEELTLPALAPHLQTADRAVRERGWRLASERRLQDRAALNELWQKLLRLRQQMATNAGFSDYRAFRWQQLGRFSYTPADAAIFHEAIATEVVPAATRVYERYRQQIGALRLRPWDVTYEFMHYTQPPLASYGSIEQLHEGVARITAAIDPALGQHFRTLLTEQLIDSPNRRGKGPGAYCAYYPASQRPFIFMNAAGSGEDVRTLLHEAGHAFHDFAVNGLPYLVQRHYPMEFAEVASMSLELLAVPYLTAAQGGFFAPADAAHYQRTQLERIILFWPYMAVVDAFQHWVYTNLDEALAPEACDAQWRQLWARFLPAIDYTGMDDALVTGWQRKQHIFRSSFYYIEYGLAQVGALQVWRNALGNEAFAVQAYRDALALGGTRPVPELYQAAGAEFAFDRPMMRGMVRLLEQQIQQLAT